MKRLLLMLLIFVFGVSFGQEYTLVKVLKNAKIRKSPEAVSDILIVVEKDTIMKCISIDLDYLKIKLDDKIVFVNATWVEKTPEVVSMIKRDEDKIKELQIRKAEKERLEIEEREKYLIKKWGKSTYLKLLNGDYWIGMNKDMFDLCIKSKKFSIGKFHNDSYGVYHNTTIETLIYEGDFETIYFTITDNKLTSYNRFIK